MRRLAACLFVLPALANATATQPARPHSVVLFVADGLRPGIIDQQTAPAMAALMKRGVTFTNSHAIFPTLAMPNAAVLATGHLPGDTGVFGNTIFTGFPVAGANDSVTPLLESNAVLGEMNDHFAGNHLNEETILHAAAAAGISTAAIGKLGPALVFDHLDRTGQSTAIVDDQTGHPGGIPLSSDMQAALQEFGLPTEAPGREENDRSGDANTPGTLVTNIAQQKWFADAAVLAVLLTFRDRHKPFVMVYWSRDPNGTQRNQGDGLLRTIPGINGPTSMAAVRNADANLGRLVGSLKELGMDTTTDVILVSAQGASTITKETATSYAASRSYRNVPPGLLPPGFLAIDLAHGLGLNIFDPDAGREARNTALPDGSFPLRGNALIGDEGAHPAMVVAANGGSDLIYLSAPDRPLVARIVKILSAQDYVSGIFVDPRLGSVAGTLPLSAVMPEGSAVTPVPSIVVGFRSFTVGCADPVTCGVEVADSILQQGQGINGSFSRADTRNVMAAIGPDFRTGFEDLAPASNADIGRTIAAILGLRMKEKGRLVGRVLTEAMPNGAKVFPKAGVLRSAPDSDGRRTVLKHQSIGSVFYFDAAGYPGRTLGLE
jgi:hypothetical protein